ncbi:hypothetical protein EVAR_61551_1 [Eumeta japonica]|uniref:Uncharacterized protein n=1 Tax=Eumeta variegata TaxID=151549 RepID=A0A4C1ZB17_EUMVA|nr:hypothetical protein EVAR_61551_1 [Eumeta japonica]
MSESATAPSTNETCGREQQVGAQPRAAAARLVRRGDRLVARLAGWPLAVKLSRDYCATLRHYRNYVSNQPHPSYFDSLLTLIHRDVLRPTQGLSACSIYGVTGGAKRIPPYCSEHKMRGREEDAGRRHTDSPADTSEVLCLRAGE